MSLRNHDYSNKERKIMSSREETMLTLIAMTVLAGTFIALYEFTGTADMMIEKVATFISIII